MPAWKTVASLGLSQKVRTLAFFCSFLFFELLMLVSYSNLVPNRYALSQWVVLVSQSSNLSFNIYAHISEWFCIPVYFLYVYIQPAPLDLNLPNDQMDCPCMFLQSNICIEPALLEITEPAHLSILLCWSHRSWSGFSSFRWVCNPKRMPIHQSGSISVWTGSVIGFSYLSGQK